MQQIQFKFGSVATGPSGGCVASIGTFDGVHLGHQAILQRLREKGKAIGLPTAVVIFEPQPLEYFSPEQAPPRLMPLREKISAFARAGLDYVVCLRFDKRLRQLTAEEFVKQVLLGQLGVKHLEIGDDFRFGCDRQGDFPMLKEAGSRYGFSVSDCHTLEIDGQRISSTRIRGLLEAGQFEEAAHLLGRPYQISGRVGYGRQLGATLGVPTANLKVGRQRMPLSGVFAVKAHLPRSGMAGDEVDTFHGVANLGVKPTLLGKRKPSLEVHMFNFEGTIYGQCLSVEFCKKIRDEQNFGSIENLQRAIKGDIAAGKAYFSQP